MTVFVDANALFSVCWSPNFAVGRLIRARRADFVTTRYAVAESHRNLPQEKRGELLRLLEGLRLVPDAFGPPPVELPAKDIPILSRAAMCGAAELVTGDETHLGRYYGQTIGGVKIVKPGDLAAELGKRRR